MPDLENTKGERLIQIKSQVLVKSQQEEAIELAFLILKNLNNPSKKPS
jgi:hypothetical protein